MTESETFALRLRRYKKVLNYAIPKADSCAARRNYFFSRMQLGKIIHAYICRFSVTALQYYRLQLGEIGFLRDNNNNKITK